MKEFVFGTFAYEYTLIKQDRKTLSLTVTPDRSIILKCPHQTEAERIESFLQKKWFWLEKQLSYFKKYDRKIYEKEYLSGEGFFYLGRQYRLVVKRAKEDGVSLTRGELVVQTTKPVSHGRHNKRLLEAWFLARTESVLQERLDEMMHRFEDKATPTMMLRDMKRRWGSFLRKEKILLNPKLIHVPKTCIDYVIVHELCHLRYKSHNAKFWQLLEEKYPGWEKVKERLELFGAQMR